jgi:hypothetical protein
LLKISSGHEIGLPMKAIVDGLSDIELGVALLGPSVLAWALSASASERRNCGPRDNTQHRDGGRPSITANSSGCAALVAMVQTADLWEGNNGARGGWLYEPRLWTILG